MTRADTTTIRYRIHTKGVLDMAALHLGKLPHSELLKLDAQTRQAAWWFFLANIVLWQAWGYC